MLRQHVSLAELHAFALDEEPLRPASRQHLDGCSSCQQEITYFRQITARLLSQLYRSQCPSATTLSYYCLPDALTEEEQRRVTDHLADCPLCQADFATTRQFLSLSE